jgi:glucuronate isomerase
MVMQLHFATYRNVNTAMFGRVGRDAGFDIMRGEVDTDRLVVFLDTLNRGGNLPKTVLYTLNPACVPALCTLSGAFPNVRIGAAWWFNDTVEGIRRQIKLAAVTGIATDTLDGLKAALTARLDYFVAHGCRISDHGMDWPPPPTAVTPPTMRPTPDGAPCPQTASGS